VGTGEGQAFQLRLYMRLALQCISCQVWILSADHSCLLGMCIFFRLGMLVSRRCGFPRRVVGPVGLQLHLGCPRRAGDLLICSSVTLKSLRTKSGLGMLLLHHFASIPFQNCRWVALLLGAYIFTKWVVSDSSSQHISIVSALPGLSSCITILFRAISALFCLSQR
jgi:hypothetical protein